MNPPQITGSRVAAHHPNADAGQNPLLLIHRLLRGRYVWAILLACILGPVGAVIGYKALPPKYESQAIIRIRPVLPKVLFENEENEMLPMFAAYVQTQVSLLTSPRVRQMVMDSQAWLDAGGGRSDDDITRFSERLQVIQPKDGQVIIVSYEDENPNRAKTAVEGLCQAFWKIQEEQAQDEDTTRLTALEERASALTNQINGLKDQIFLIANEYGSDALDSIYEYKVQELQKIETELKAAQLQLATLESASQTGTDVSDAQMSEDQIAAVDRQMQQLVSERNQLKVQLADIEAKYTKSKTRPEYLQLQRQLEAKEVEIQQYARAYRESGARRSPSLVTQAEGMPPVITITDPVRAKERVDRIQKLYDEARSATLDLGRENIKLQGLRSDLLTAQERLKETDARREQLSVEKKKFDEKSIDGRISMLSNAELPISPSNAKKFKQFAVLGGLAGVGLGVGIILLIGLINPKIRYIADAEEQHPRLLGAVPSLPDELTDPTEAMVAAQCVHRIRVMLQPRVSSDRGRALTVTSAAPGTGKTSLTLALGLSFAASGARTLIIDGDVVGMGLSRRTRDVGSKAAKLTLAYQGAAHSHAEEEGSAAISDALGARSLVNLGLADETAPHDESNNGSFRTMGLLDVLRGAPVDHCLTYIGVPNLSVMPAGGSLNGSVTVMSRTAMTALVDSLRDSYEMILIDTGPVPGPTDSSVMSGSTDGVIMVASRGEQLAVVRQALQHLELIQAPLVGMVFNRARVRDLEQTGHSSVSSGHQNGHSNGHRTNGHIEPDDSSRAFARLGPLAQAVLFMSNLVHTDHGSADGKAV